MLQAGQGHHRDPCYPGAHSEHSDIPAHPRVGEDPGRRCREHGALPWDARRTHQTYCSGWLAPGGIGGRRKSTEAYLSKEEPWKNDDSIAGLRGQVDSVIVNDRRSASRRGWSSGRTVLTRDIIRPVSITSVTTLSGVQLWANVKIPVVRQPGDSGCESAQRHRRSASPANADFPRLGRERARKCWLDVRAIVDRAGSKTRGGRSHDGQQRGNACDYRGHGHAAGGES